ncbi:MAG: hypothetical protein JST13_04715 [Bacteroidetes bacterium]|nr:hypothetical protein [Bacteroidota bacterium]
MPFTLQPKVFAPVCVMGGSCGSATDFLQLQPSTRESRLMARIKKVVHFMAMVLLIKVTLLFNSKYTLSVAWFFSQLGLRLKHCVLG